ncbi:DUF853 family protein [Gammaproteobacteria bacterium]|nr:DUF853 family protein [Gammaproteobacteria bacterium]
MSDVQTILLGGDSAGQVTMNPRMANRHGLISGATGTGKTISLQVLTESFSRIGVPSFVADIKGDLSGLARPAKSHPKIDERIEKIGITDYQAQAVPVVFWDLFGKGGHPLRSTISEMGPLLLSNLFDLNETQSGILYAAFRIADDEGMLLLDLKDLRSLLNWMGEHRKELRNEYGNISSASIGAIQRRLLMLEEEGAEHFFGEPAIDFDDLIKHDFSGNGVVNVMDVTQLVHRSPRLYATFLLWLLSELFENLPEIGDPDKPVMVFFFDEAHLLFDDAPDALVDKIEQVVRLIRSKGVGVYFITQNPLDVPEEVLGQLGMKIQHALRAFTPKDQRAIKTVADTFPANDAFDTGKVITELGIGEALVSTLDDEGRPSPVARTLMSPPRSQIGPIDDTERAELMKRSPFAGRYDESIDRESAYEQLKERADAAAKEAERIAAEEAATKAADKLARTDRSRRSTSQGFAEDAVNRVVRSMTSQVGRQIGRQIVRGLLGGLFGSRRRR